MNAKQRRLAKRFVARNKGNSFKIRRLGDLIIAKVSHMAPNDPHPVCNIKHVDPYHDIGNRWISYNSLKGARYA